MNSTLRAFLTRLIDYAGLFPPASLELEPAFANFLAYHDGPDAWMLGRFVVPISRLEGVKSLLGRVSPHERLPLAVLTSRASDASAYQAILHTEMSESLRFAWLHGSAVSIEVVESALPPGPLDRGLLAMLASSAAEAGLRAFVEVPAPLDTRWESATVAALDALAAHNATRQPALGFKLRTGGLVAEAFPTPAQLALAIVGCRERKIAMKCTAGLHHPFRMYRDEVGAPMHGFVNVFAAGILAKVHTLNRTTVTALLEDKAPGHFSFAEEGLRWHELLATPQQIADAREQALLSFGSCSFDEPRQELRALNIL